MNSINHNDFNGMNNTKKRKENFVDNESYYSRNRHPSIDITNSNYILNPNISNRSPSNILIRPASNIVNRVPSRVSSRPPSSRRIPSFKNVNTEQNNNLLYKTIYTQGNLRYDEENGSIQKKLENKNPFYIDSSIDIIHNYKKPNNNISKISIDNTINNKNRLRNNLSKYGYNVIATSGNDIISKNKKNKDYYQELYDNDKFDLDKLPYHETIMQKKLKKKK